MKMVKAKLEEVGGLGKLEFKFNPSEYSVQKSAQWDAPRRSMSTEAGAKPEFIGTNPQTVNMQIFFDDWEAAVGDVTKDVEKLFKWCTPSRNRSETKPRIRRCSALSGEATCIWPSASSTWRP